MATHYRTVPKLGLTSYAIFVQDYGAPIGWRMALEHPERIAAIITQNGNAYEDGIVDKIWAEVFAYDAAPSPETAAGAKEMQSEATVKWRYLHYPKFQEYFRTSQVPLLATWGEHDEIFPPADVDRGVWAPTFQLTAAQSGWPRDEEVAAVPITTVLAVIPVADFDSACGWFESFFGRPADQRPMDSLAEWHLSELGIVQVFQSPDKAGQTAVNFVVDDLDKYLAGLASKGITATEPQEVSQGRQRLATVTDPDGNQLSLIEQVLKGR